MNDTRTPTLISDSAFWNRRDWFLLGILVLCTFSLYVRTAHFEFVAYDDNLYVYRDARVLQGMSFANFHWAITAIVGGNWHPLTMIAYMTLSSLFGRGPGAFHVSCTLLHTLNVAMLFTFLRKSTGRARASFFAVGLWGLHPLRAESVAWISELKDVMCGALWLGCMLAYLRYSRQRTLGRYGIVALLLALALLVKPMAGTLPAALLLLDFWPLRQTDAAVNKTKWWTARVLEKLPLLVIALADMGFAVHTQRNYIGPKSAVFPLGLRIENALVSCVAYLRDMFFPHNLIPFYPHPAMVNQTIPILYALLAAGLLVTITVIVCVRLKSQPYLAVGWFWFLGTLIPVLGIVRLGQQARADRYTYLPMIGLTVAVVWLISDLVAVRNVLRTTAAIAGTLAMAGLAIASWYTIGHWKTSRTLFDYTRQVEPNNFLAMDFYAGELREARLLDQSVQVGRNAVAIAPRNAAMHADLGQSLEAAGDLPGAVKEFSYAVELSPGSCDYWDGLAAVRGRQAYQAKLNHDPGAKILQDAAIEDFKIAIFFDPDTIDARGHLAVELASAGRFDEAIKVWNELLALDPNDAQAQGDLADALRVQHDIPGAIEHYRAALALGAKNSDWETELAYRVATSPEATNADVQPLVLVAKDACDQTQNRSAAALDAYAACLARVGRFDDAVAAGRQAVAQANAAQQHAIAKDIQNRLKLYELALPYIAGAETSAQTPTTQSATTQGK